MSTIEDIFHARVDRLGGRVLATCFNQPTEWHSTAHEHSSPQLLALTKGAASVQTASGRCVLLPQRCLYLPSNTMHSMDTAGPVQGFVLYLNEAIGQTLTNRVFAFHGNRLLLEILRRLADLTEAAQPSVQEENLVRVLIDEIQRSADLPLEIRMPIDRKLRALANDILRNPGEHLTLDEWAAKADMSKRTLLRRFKDETGLPVGQWVQHARIFSAAALLREGVSVKQAAASVGYDSVSSFIKSFARIMGTTPGSLHQSDDPGLT